MALSTYSELLASIAAWAKPNTTLPAAESALIPDYIRLAEAEFDRVLRVDAMEDVDTAYAITLGAGMLPSGFLSVLSIRLTEEPYNRVTGVPLAQLESLDPRATHKPMHWAIAGSGLLFWPPTSATARFRYREGVTPLSDAAPTNWLLTKHPDLYLYGALVHAGSRFVNPDQLSIAMARYAEARRQVEQQDMAVQGGSLSPLPGVTAVI